MDPDLNSRAKTVQGEGSDEEGEWRGRGLDAIGNRLTNGALG